MINDPKYSIKGLILLNGESVRDQRYADDTNMYLEGSEENLQATYELLQSFCEASGAKINWDKSYAVALRESRRSRRWGEEKGLKWL